MNSESDREDMDALSGVGSQHQDAQHNEADAQVAQQAANQALQSQHCDLIMPGVSPLLAPIQQPLNSISPSLLVSPFITSTMQTPTGRLSACESQASFMLSTQHQHPHALHALPRSLSLTAGSMQNAAALAFQFGNGTPISQQAQLRSQPLMLATAASPQQAFVMTTPSATPTSQSSISNSINATQQFNSTSAINKTPQNQSSSGSNHHHLNPNSASDQSLRHSSRKRAPSALLREIAQTEAELKAESHQQHQSQSASGSTFSEKSRKRAAPAADESSSASPNTSPAVQSSSLSSRRRQPNDKSKRQKTEEVSSSAKQSKSSAQAANKRKSSASSTSVAAAAAALASNSSPAVKREPKQPTSRTPVAASNDDAVAALTLAISESVPSDTLEREFDSQFIHAFTAPQILVIHQRMNAETIAFYLAPASSISRSVLDKLKAFHGAGSNEPRDAAAFKKLIQNPAYQFRLVDELLFQKPSSCIALNRNISKCFLVTFES